MISTKRATLIICEKDKDKRNELIDKLSDENAKYLLKQYLKTGGGIRTMMVHIQLMLGNGLTGMQMVFQNVTISMKKATALLIRLHLMVKP